jgi:hypothetical protein
VPQNEPLTERLNDMTTAAAITDLNQLCSFLFAGSAKFTLVSKKTGARKTFEVRQKGIERFWFVSLLNGPDNTADFRYLACVWMDDAADLKAKMNKDAWGKEAFDAFNWLLEKLNANDAAGFYAQAEFWHSGTCGRCGRELTTPESIARGLGPTCAELS